MNWRTALTVYFIFVVLGGIFYFSFSKPVFIIFLAALIFFLYIFTIFIVAEAKEKPINWKSFIIFLRFRRWSIILFAFSLLILSILIIFSGRQTVR
ncbi:MAG: hypothetical protein N2572_03030 [Syntrophales bacterium]|nr:hypothetical protein [Syntrophales bacterium]